MLSWSEEVASATFWDTSGVAYSDPDLGVSGWPAFSDDGGHVAFGRYGKWVALFTTSGDRIWEIEARSIQSLAVADGGGRVAVARRAQRDTRVLMLNEAGQLLWDIMLDSYRVHGVSFSPSGDKLAVLEYTESGYAVSVLSAETGSQQSRCALGEPSGAGYRGYSFLAVDENGSAVTAIPTPDDAGIVVLPNGRKFVLTVFITGRYRGAFIRNVSRDVCNYFMGNGL